MFNFAAMFQPIVEEEESKVHDQVLIISSLQSYHWQREHVNFCLIHMYL